MHLSEQDLNQIRATLINVLSSYRQIARQINSCLLILREQGEGNRLATEIIDQLAQSENRDPYPGKYFDPTEEYNPLDEPNPNP
jgi:hypothetical protein